MFLKTRKQHTHTKHRTQVALSPLETPLSRTQHCQTASQLSHLTHARTRTHKHSNEAAPAALFVAAHSARVTHIRQSCDGTHKAICVRERRTLTLQCACRHLSCRQHCIQFSPAALPFAFSLGETCRVVCLCCSNEKRILSLVDCRHYHHYSRVICHIL